MQRRKKVGLLDHMGGGNLGDDATQTAVIENILKRWPDCEICALSMNPTDTQARHNVPSYPLRARVWAFGGEKPGKQVNLKSKFKTTIGRFGGIYRGLQLVNYLGLRLPRILYRELLFLIKSFAIVRSFDLLIISGGGQLMDLWGGPWGFPYTIFKWIILAKLAHIRCIVLNVGAGPLERRLSKYFIGVALSASDYVSFRDKKSFNLIRGIGFNGKAEVFPDCVYGLDAAEFAQEEKQSTSVVGIAPMAYADPNVYPEHDPAVYHQLIDSLDSLGSWLVHNSYSLKLFCSDIGVDPPAIEDLRSHLMSSCKSPLEDAIAIPSLKSGADLLVNMASMDYVVTCRFHGVVFAHILNKPVIAISHHPKMSTLMNDLGLEEYCIDMHACDADVLTDKLVSLVKNGQAIKKKMAEKLACYREELAEQFDQLFPNAIHQAVIEQNKSSETYSSVGMG